MIKLILRISSFLLFSIQAFGYITATYGSQGSDPNIRTHVMIAGKGNELSTMFQVVAAGKAKKYVDMYPNEQVLLISAEEISGNVEFLQGLGFKNVVDKSRGGFSSSDVFSEMEKLSKIASVDIFSHSVAYYGVILDGKFNRMDPKKDGYAALKSHFTSDAYAFLHGCNSGQFLAPILSLQWEIPVAGSFTSSDFQALHSSSNFYFDEPGRRPTQGSFVGKNKLSYSKTEACPEGGCLRLFPDNFVYNGFWGEFTEGGLGFYKFFCMKNSDEVCFKVMAKSALEAVSVKSVKVTSSLADFKIVVQDWLCPISATTDVRQRCIAGLEGALKTGNETFDIYDGKSLQCSFKGCLARFKCKRIQFLDLLQEGSCQVFNDRTSSKTTTLVREYKAYLKGFQLLKADAGIN